MMNSVLVLVVHIGAAVGALITGVLAVRFPNGTRAHRRLGKAYMGMWITLFVGGVIIGWGRPGISAFEVLNALGMSFVTLGYALIPLRRRIGPRWVSLHYICMLTSLAFIIVAAANQMLPRIGVPYPWWGLVVLSILPFFVIPPYVARLDRRYVRRRAASMQTVK